MLDEEEAALEKETHVTHSFLSGWRGAKLAWPGGPERRCASSEHKPMFRIGDIDPALLLAAAAAAARLHSRKQIRF